MKITSTYSVRLRNFNLVFDDTVEVYRHAVDYFIEGCVMLDTIRSIPANPSPCNDEDHVHLLRAFAQLQPRL